MKVKDHFLSGEYFDLIETKISGVLQTHPVPEDLDDYYESKKYISHHQDDKTFKNRLYKIFQGYNLKYKRSILDDEITKNSRVLDYGFGAGDFLKFIENDFRTFGFEPSPAARNAALHKLGKTKIISDLSPLPDQSLDAITLWHVFEHIPNPHETLDLFKKKLKDSGKLIIAVPNHQSYDARFYQQYWAAYDVPRHLFHFSTAGMCELMSQNGWSVSKKLPLYLDAFYISILSEKYRKNLFFWFLGPLRGWISNFKASKSGDFSSLIYVIEKK